MHDIQIAASRERVDSAIRSVTPEEIRHFRTLTWLRRFAEPGRPGVLNPPAGQPILNTFTSGGLITETRIYHAGRTSCGASQPTGG